MEAGVQRQSPCLAGRLELPWVMGVGVKLTAASQFIRLWMLHVAPAAALVGALVDVALGLLMAIALLKTPRQMGSGVNLKLWPGGGGDNLKIRLILYFLRGYLCISCNKTRPLNC